MAERVGRRAAAAAVVSAALLGCQAGESPPSGSKRADDMDPVARAEAAGGKTYQLVEGRQKEISGFNIATGSVGKHDLADEHGIIASRMSATLHVNHPDTDEGYDYEVVAGSIIDVGKDRYLVVEVYPGTSIGRGRRRAPGSGNGIVTIRQLLPADGGPP